MESDYRPILQQTPGRNKRRESTETGLGPSIRSLLAANADLTSGNARALKLNNSSSSTRQSVLLYLLEEDGGNGIHPIQKIRYMETTIFLDKQIKHENRNSSYYCCSETNTDNGSFFK